MIDFQLLNEDGLTIGKARLDLPTEDVQAAKLGLKATGEAYSQCRTLIYHIFWQDNGPQECRGLMNIRPCPEVCWYHAIGGKLTLIPSNSHPMLLGITVNWWTWNRGPSARCGTYPKRAAQWPHYNVFHGHRRLTRTAERWRLRTTSCIIKTDVRL